MMNTDSPTPEEDNAWAALENRIAAQNAALLDWKVAVQTAYGHLWRVNNEPGTPNQYSPEQAAYEARKLLCNLLTKAERSEGISAALMGIDLPVGKHPLYTTQAQPATSARPGLAFYSVEIGGAIYDLDVTDRNGSTIAGLSIKARPQPAAPDPELEKLRAFAGGDQWTPEEMERLKAQRAARDEPKLSGMEKAFSSNAQARREERQGLAQKPVAWRCDWPSGYVQYHEADDLPDEWEDPPASITPLYAVPVAAQAEPVSGADGLLPCPFCGDRAALNVADETVNVRCEGWNPGVCLGAGPNCYTEAEAIAGWNRRAQPQPSGNAKHLADDTRVGILADTYYINGLKHGYSLGRAGNEAGYQQMIAATRAQISDAQGRKDAVVRDEQALEEALRERDEIHEMADSLAEAIGNYFDADIGEHSSANCPWHRALEIIEEIGEREYAQTAAAATVLAERRRQIEAEGWTPEHDDQHAAGEMAAAAAAYAMEAEQSHGGLPMSWPWSLQWWKPSTPRRNLVKAGALILAEIERIDRAAGRE